MFFFFCMHACMCFYSSKAFVKKDFVKCQTFCHKVCILHLLFHYRTAHSSWDMQREGSWAWKTSIEHYGGAILRYIFVFLFERVFNVNLVLFVTLQHLVNSITPAACFLDYLRLWCTRCPTIPSIKGRRAFLCRGSGDKSGGVGTCY